MCALFSHRLDGKHVVFGSVTDGFDTVVKEMEKVGGKVRRAVNTAEGMGQKKDASFFRLNVIADFSSLSLSLSLSHSNMYALLSFTCTRMLYTHTRTHTHTLQHIEWNVLQRSEDC